MYWLENEHNFRACKNNSFIHIRNFLFVDFKLQRYSVEKKNSQSYSIKKTPQLAEEFLVKFIA